jgi:hypothetical protein
MQIEPLSNPGKTNQKRAKKSVCVHRKAAKPFGGVHPWRKYDCEYSQPFIEEGEPHLNIGSGESITLCPSQILDIRVALLTVLRLKGWLSGSDYHIWPISADMAQWRAILDSALTVSSGCKFGGKQISWCRILARGGRTCHFQYWIQALKTV